MPVYAPLVSNFPTNYAVKLDRNLNSDDAFIATVTFRDCKQKDGQACGDTAPISCKQLILEPQRNSLVFDGIPSGGSNRPDYPGRFV
jgi:hypothetical protein